MYKIAKILAIILSLVGFVLWIMIVQSDDNEGVVSLMISLGLWLTVIIAGITLVLSLIGLASDGEKLKKSLISVVAFAVIVAVSYLVLATGKDVNLDEMANRGIEATEGTVKVVGAGLWSFYLLAAVAVIAMLVGGLKKQ